MRTLGVASWSATNMGWWSESSVTPNTSAVLVYRTSAGAVPSPPVSSASMN
jgi:hypothetical protein